jgi:hypothetical protein
MRKAELALAGGVLLLVLYAGWRLKTAAGAAGAAVVGAAGAGWQLANTPVIDPALPGAWLANGIVAAPASTLDALSFGTIGGTTGPASDWYDALKAGPLGGLVGIVSGDGNTNFFGPAPSAGLDFGHGSNTWND